MIRQSARVVWRFKMAQVATEYQWLLDAAGNDEKRLAQLSLLLAGAAMATMASASQEQAIPMILEMRAAIHEIGIRMNIDMDKVTQAVWGTTGHG
jgi:hypothetical protein